MNGDIMIKIEWNEKKCTDPRECYRCFDACPEGVFMTYPRDKRGPGKAAGNWAIIPAFLKLCSGCRICEQMCPENALTISVLKESVA
jgi:NAD-dependent dihydropyrimidine dehydrogenase PreA subunit